MQTFYYGKSKLRPFSPAAADSRLLQPVFPAAALGISRRTRARGRYFWDSP